MNEKEERVLILTVRLDNVSQEYFNTLRLQHFPPERNFLKAHLTLFHQLPDTPETVQIVSGLSFSPFAMEITGLFNLGAGVAFRVESQRLTFLRAELRKEFNSHLNAQDKQGFRGHITVQNKTSPEIARSLLASLSQNFTAFEIQAIGLDLWYYLGGPWEHKQFVPFG